MLSSLFPELLSSNLYRHSKLQWEGSYQPGLEVSTHYNQELSLLSLCLWKVTLHNTLFTLWVYFRPTLKENWNIWISVWGHSEFENTFHQHHVFLTMESVWVALKINNNSWPESFFAHWLPVLYVLRWKSIYAYKGLWNWKHYLNAALNQLCSNIHGDTRRSCCFV